MSPVPTFLEKHELLLALLLIGVPLAVALPLLIGMTQHSLFAWLVTEVMFGGMYLIVAVVFLRQAKKKKTWKKIAAEMGLNYVSTSFLRPQFMEGAYRKHHVGLYIGSEDGSQYTGYSVQFENPEGISMHIYREGLSSKIGRRLSIQDDIKLNDPEFDRTFVIKGNRPFIIKDLLDAFLRIKILNTRDFNILIDEKLLNMAHCREKRVITNTERLRSILDLMVDIVEKIEKA